MTLESKIGDVKAMISAQLDVIEYQEHTFLGYVIRTRRKIYFIDKENFEVLIKERNVNK